MKHTLLLTLSAFTACLTLSTPALRAQAVPVQDEPAEEELPPFDAEAEKKKMKEAQKEADAEVRKYLKVFKSLEGEWTGTEKVEYAIERLNGLNKEWKDVWKGFFTVDGRYFEMTGQTEGEDSQGYRWVCTWDAAEDVYKAWYFGESSQTEYTGELSSDGKYVIWKYENEAQESETKFSMIADGDKVKCSGTDRIAGQVLSRQSSSYTRKKVEL